MGRFDSGCWLTILALALAAGPSVAAAQDTWYVDDDAGAGGDGTSSRPFRAIEQALDVASGEDTIVVRAGTYPEDLLVERKIVHFVGAGCGQTIIRPPSGSVGIDIGLFGGATVRAIAFDLDYATGIRSSGPSALRLEVEDSCFVGADSGVGIAYVDPVTSTVQTSSFDTLSRGIYVIDWTPDETLRVSDDAFTDNWTALDLDGQAASFSLRAYIFSNQFSDNWNGIQVDTDGRAYIGSNYFEGDYRSIWVGTGDHAVFTNVIVGAGANGWSDARAIGVVRSRALVAHNTIIDSLVGIYCWGSATTPDQSYIVNNAILHTNDGDPAGPERGLVLGSACEAGFEANAAHGYGLPSRNIVVGPDATDLGGNLDDRSFALGTRFGPTTSASPLVGAGVALSAAYLGADYWGVSRGTSPEIGAVEWVTLFPRR